MFYYIYVLEDKKKGGICMLDIAKISERESKNIIVG